MNRPGRRPVAIQCTLAIRRPLPAPTLPTVRTFLLIMTVVGGLLSLGAAVWVALLARRARWRQRNLAFVVRRVRLRTCSGTAGSTRITAINWPSMKQVKGRAQPRRSAEWTKNCTTTRSPTSRRRIPLLSTTVPPLVIGIP